MKRITTLICAALLFAACNNSQEQQNPADEQNPTATDPALTEKSQEQILRDAISDYLVKEIGSQYAQGKLCIPVLTMVATEEQDADHSLVWGDFWVFNYNLAGDTLKTVSGGNHSGCMTVQKQDGTFTITSFEQTVDGAGYEASAKRIFGQYYDKFQKVQSDQAARKEQLKEYVSQHGLNARCYQDYGREAVEL